jgi:hypothetical protein
VLAECKTESGGGAEGGGAGARWCCNGDGGSGRGKRNWKDIKHMVLQIKSMALLSKKTHANCATMSAGHMAQGP